MTEYREKVEAKRKEVVNSLLQNIEAAQLQWRQGWVNVGAAPPENAVSNKHYNGFNFLNLYFIAMKRNYEDPRWLTFKQAQDIGASINIGERASSIFYFTKYDTKTHKPYDIKTTESMSRNVKLEYERENVRMVLKYYSVFNGEQCENMPVRLKPEPMNEEERTKQNQLMEKIIANSAAPISYDGENRAYYNIPTDSIHLPLIKKFVSKDEYYATTLHEIAHSTMTESRLNRKPSNDRTDYAFEELRAELACVFLQSELGIQLDGKHFENHAAYLQAWLKRCKEDSNIFLEAVGDASKISDYIIENYAQPQNASIISQEKTQEKNERPIVESSHATMQEYQKEKDEAEFAATMPSPTLDTLSKEIPKNRLKELSDFYDNETNDEETREWRHSITLMEQQLVDIWDKSYAEGLVTLLRQIKELEKVQVNQNIVDKTSLPIATNAFESSKDLLKKCVISTRKTAVLTTKAPASKKISGKTSEKLDIGNEK